MAEQPEGDISTVEAGVAALAARLRQKEAEIGEANARYLAAAQREALGEAPVPNAAELLAGIGPLQITRDGLRAAHGEATARLASLIVAHQQRESEQAAAAHLAQFEALVGEATVAAAAVEAAWRELGAHLWRFDTARDLLFAEQFRPQRGGDVAQQLQDHLRKMRATAMNSGRRCTSHIEYGEILAIEGEKK